MGKEHDLARGRGLVRKVWSGEGAWSCKEHDLARGRGLVRCGLVRGRGLVSCDLVSGRGLVRVCLVQNKIYRYKLSF